MDGNALKVKSYLEALCSRGECCSKDIYEKALKRLEGDAETAAEILRELVEDKFVDDLRYASAFARDKSSLNGWGPIKIKYALAAKGIRGETASAALAGIDPEKADEKLESLLASKRKSLEGDPALKLKLIKFALSRGYDYDAVEKALTSLLQRP